MSAVAHDELDVARALHRAAMYRLLGAALGHPERDQLAEVARVARTAAADPSVAPEIRPLLAALELAVGDGELDAIIQEHVRLFDRQVRCSPYESAYVEAGGMAGKPAMLADIAGFYAAFGLADPRDRVDAEDHIAAELEFMSVLALKEAFALGEGHADGLEVTRRAEASYLDDHLGRWAGAFAGALREATALPYYAAIADLVSAWLAAECEAAGVAPAPPTRCAPQASAEDDVFRCPMVAEADEPDAI